jgi:ppGpp synthetase/RelA/SpoT-type nucleotidyltranferase
VSTPRKPAIDEIFRQHLEEWPFWNEVVELLRAELETTIRRLRIPGKVEARAKSTGSVIGKAYRKPEKYSDLSLFGDLAAARVLVPFASDVEPTAREIVGHPAVSILRDETKIRKPDELTYQARHLDLVLDPEYGITVPPSFVNRVVRCEVQIQTFSQSLWANMSHLVTYKQEDLPGDVLRKVNRLVVLCELFDDESEQSRTLALKNVDSVTLIASELQRYFFGITGHLTDPNQSLAIVSQLLPTLDKTEASDFPSILEEFVQSYAERLTLLLTDRPEARGLPWLLRPESLLIFERITHRPAQFARAWDKTFPAADRQALEAAWGPDA